MCKLGREKMINDECSLKKKRIEIVIMAERLYKSVNICLIAVSLGSSTNCHSEEPGGGDWFTLTPAVMHLKHFFYPHKRIFSHLFRDVG